jgi:hypothetical protein
MQATTTRVEHNAQQVRNAYLDYMSRNGRPATGEYMSTHDVARHLKITLEDLNQAVVHLVINDPNFEVIPESNQRALTADRRAWAVRVGNQDRHLIGWY